MKWFLMWAACIVSTSSLAEKLTEAQLNALLEKVNQAQNLAIMVDAKVADADALFDLYTQDFEYVHEKYGGTYTRKELYDNTVKYINQGAYTFTHDRYKILQVLPGENAVAVTREQTWQGEKEVHLAVFEFRGDKVSKIIEYW